MQGMLIIDADGHVTESDETIKSRMKEEYRNVFFKSKQRDAEHWNSRFDGTLGKVNDDPRVQLEDLDLEGIDIQVVFPTGLSLNARTDAAVAADRARAYNDWLAEFCSFNPNRLKGVALIAFQDVQTAIDEALRATQELGHVAIMMPTNVCGRDIAGREFWPFYEQMDGLGIPVALHGGIQASANMYGRFKDNFLSVHTVAFPFECMAALTGLIYAGVPELFPNMKMAVLEGSVGWLPFLMDRMDEEFEIRGSREAPSLKKKPSDYLGDGRFYYGFEIEESTIPFIIDRIGADKLMYASDYPHWDSSWPNTTKTFLKRDDISDADKRLILGENPQQFYGFRAETAETIG